jgi:hypothetical protein
MVRLSIFLACAAIMIAGTVAQLPRLLQLMGLTPTGVIAASALLGPGQVIARLLEFTMLQRLSPVTLGCVAIMLHPLGVMFVFLFGVQAGVVFTLLHAAGSGFLTIARGTLPLALFGAAGYGLRTGVISIPSRIAQAFAPYVFSLLISSWGLGLLVVSSTVCFVGLLVLAMLGGSLPRAQQRE